MRDYIVQVRDRSGWRTVLTLPENVMHPSTTCVACAIPFTRDYRHVRAIGPTTIKQNPCKVLARWKDGKQEGA